MLSLEFRRPLHLCTVECLETEVVISGAGPAGAMAALKLGKAGIPCILVDKSAFPRDKVCGDALSGKVVEILRKVDPVLVQELGTHTAAQPSWGVSFIAPNGKVLRVPFRKDYNPQFMAPPGYIIPRLDFDSWLHGHAVSQPGVTFISGVSLTRFQEEHGQILVSDAEGKTGIRASFLIAADGAHSAFAKMPGGIHMEPRHYCAGVRAYYKGVQDLDPDGFIELNFLNELLPGYFWIFPLPDGRANVGLGIRSDVVSRKNLNLKRIMQDLIATHPQLKGRFSEAKAEGPIRGFGLPLGSKVRNIAGKGFFLTGDAASLIDPFTGEGIGNALYSGYFAAQSILDVFEGKCNSADVPRKYQKAVYDRLWQELRLSHRMQQMVAYPWLFNMVVNKALKNETLRETISCMFEDMDLRHKLKDPGFYFKLIFN